MPSPDTTAASQAVPTGAASRFPGALSEPGFRRFALSTLVWGIAHQLVTLAQGYTVFALTDSTLYLAWLGAAVGVPQLVFSGVGGFLNDRLPRKPLLIAGSTAVCLAMAGVTVSYAVGALEPWHLLAAGAVQGGFLGLDWTTRNAMLPGVASRPRLVSAVSADLTAFNLARIVAPLAGSVVLAGAPVYGVIAGLLAANVLLVMSLRYTDPGMRAQHPPVWADAAEVARVVRQDSIISINLAFTAINALLLGGVIYLLPAFTKDVFGAGEKGLSGLFTAAGICAFIAGGWLAMGGRLKRAGWWLLACNILFALSAALFAATGNLAIGTASAGALGFFNSIHVALGAAALQIASPEETRGRVFGAYEVAWGMFPLGGLVLGALARATGVQWAVAAGALAVLVYTVAVLAFSPRIRGLRF
jgi:MFS family permease